MKEIEDHPKDQVEIVKQVQQKKQHKLIGRVNPHSGHTCFEFNKKTLELRKASFEKQASVNYLSPDKPQRRVIETKEDCIYINALNAKNAARKLMSKYKFSHVVHILE